jgi:hypothetical protein
MMEHDFLIKYKKTVRVWSEFQSKSMEMLHYYMGSDNLVDGMCNYCCRDWFQNWNFIDFMEHGNYASLNGIFIDEFSFVDGFGSIYL